MSAPVPNYRRYLWVLFGVTALVLVPIAAANYVLVERSFGGERLAREASAWQQATRGVTYSPPLSQNRPFKVLRLNDRLPELNALVLGSSTVMGLSADAFPGELRAYNFSQSANLLGPALAEAEALVAQPQVQWMVVPLDWAIGLVFEPLGTPTAAQLLGPEAVAGPPPPGRLALLGDALSAPRVRDLFRALRGILRAPDSGQAFRAVFLGGPGVDYACPDGTPARDFDTIHRGRCVGFRFDGSATFGNLKPLTAATTPAVLAAAARPDSPYVAPLVRAKGEPPAAALARLAVIAAKLQARGGDLIVLIPPLLPGLERAVVANPAASAALRHWTDTLAAWGVQHRVTVLDAAASERYGCTAAEFVDAHHALPPCFLRVFTRYWEERRSGALRPGVYRGEPLRAVATR
jgi:hypothetical protein